MTSNSIQIIYFSGYIRNWQSLCDTLGITLPLSREKREAAILRNAYAKWGTNMAEQLCGMFAVVLYDENEKKYYICRDQVGQKQLFYAVADGELLCTGDIDAIASDARMEKRLNKKMLQQYLFYGYPIGTETFYEGIYKFPAGNWAAFDGKSFELHRYFAPVFTPDESKTVDEWAAENGRKTRRHYAVAFVAVTLMGMLVLSTVLPQRYSNARTNQLTVAEAGLRVETILGTINNSKV